MSDDVYFLHAEKHESFLKIVTVIFDVVKNSQSSQNSNFAMSLQYHNKEVRDKVDFLLADKHRIFLQVDFSTLGVKVSCKMILSLFMGWA